MARYRGPLGTVAAVQFTGRHDSNLLSFDDEDDAGAPPVWVMDALNAKTIDVSAMGPALVLAYRGGSYGLVKGDWLLCSDDGEIAPCCARQFAERYKRVDG